VLFFEVDRLCCFSDLLVVLFLVWLVVLFFGLVGCAVFRFWLVVLLFCFFVGLVVLFFWFGELCCF
jgi:hypothetical protein